MYAITLNDTKVDDVLGFEALGFKKKATLGQILLVNYFNLSLWKQFGPYL